MIDTVFTLKNAQLAFHLLVLLDGRFFMGGAFFRVGAFQIFLFLVSLSSKAHLSKFFNLKA